MRNFAFVFLFALSAILPPLSSKAAERPNVVVIMVDDLGFSDIGCYGGEIETPHIDALAKNGLRFSQFYNTAKCHSSRVSLLTGQYCLAAGDTAMSKAVTTAEVLRENGYFTAMTGKWHLDKQPTDFGFQKYFGHLSGACNFFSGDKTFRLNGTPWEVPDKDFYTTVANVDFGLDFLTEARQTGKPWYLYIAFNAPHSPLHALPEDYARYKGKYKDGWDIVRDARIAKQKELGILPATLSPSPRPEHIPAWDEMDQWKQDYEANRMSTLAAMIDRVDQEVGRLVGDLKKNGELDNTMILFISDNGACPYDRKAPILDAEPTKAEISFGDSTGWAWARNSPFRYYKQNQFEGGISTPAIVHWPAGLKHPGGAITHQPAHLIDVLPTLADITGSTIPDTWTGRDLRPVSGISLRPVLEGNLIDSRPPIHFLFSSDRGLRDGDWKLVSFQSAAWELYNLANDRTELHNLADQEPERVKRMAATWHEMAGNVLHASKRSREPVKEAELPHTHFEWTRFDAEKPEDYIRKKKRKTPQGNIKFRARKNTKMKIIGNKLHLQFTGEDPGLAMDLRGKDLPAGPYQVTFQLKSKEKVTGEIFYTIDPQKTLPKGVHLTFPVQGTEKWQDVAIDLETDKLIHQLRIDIGEGPGEAVISDLQLLGNNGKSLVHWPAKRK
ncbi:MAG: arylsulfatase [Verrucomicrobiales bacterium]|nr:arylsulfatase [Verrucomicrobiales bacterium]